jgi:flagellar basal body-associated protein FliL
MSEKLRQAIELIKAGNKQTALPILKEVIQSEPNNDAAWLWLYTCVDNPSQKKYCLQKALEINPNNSNAQIALEKLIGQIPSPKPTPIRPQTQPAKIIEKSVQRPMTQKKSGNKSPIVIVGLAVIFLILCIGIGGISYWAYNNILRDSVLANAPANTPNPNGIAPLPQSMPQTSQPEVSQNQPFTANQLSSDNVKLLSVYFLKTPADDSAWSLIKFTVAIENYTNSELEFKVSSAKAILKTQQGYEYSCSGRPDGTTNNHQWTSAELERVNSNDIIMSLPFPEYTRTVFSHIYCVVPTESSGYTFQLIGKFSIVPINYWSLNNFENPVSPELKLEMEPEKVDSNLNFPLLYDLSSFPQENTLTYNANQQVDLGDATLTFRRGSTKDLVGDDGFGILMGIQNKFSASNIKISARGYILDENGRKSPCYLQTDINIGQSTEVAFCNNLLVAPQVHSCVYIDDLIIKYMVQNKDDFLISKHLVVCLE